MPQLMSLCLSWVLPWFELPRQEQPSLGLSCAAMRTWLEGPDPSPELGGSRCVGGRSLGKSPLDADLELLFPCAKAPPQPSHSSALGPARKANALKVLVLDQPVMR